MSVLYACPFRLDEYSFIPPEGNCAKQCEQALFSIENVFTINFADKQ